MTTQQQSMDAIEPLVDASSVSEVLFALARVCNEKAEHILCNWQDKKLARRWDTLARSIDTLANKTEL